MYFIKHAFKHLIIKPFDLLNTIPLTRAKTIVNCLLMSKFYWKISLEHKLRISVKVILNQNGNTANPAETYVRKNLCTRKNFMYTNLPPWIYKNILLENAKKKALKSNNRYLNRVWINTVYFCYRKSLIYFKSLTCQYLRFLIT